MLSLVEYWLSCFESDNDYLEKFMSEQPRPDIESGGDKLRSQFAKLLRCSRLLLNTSNADLLRQAGQHSEIVAAALVTLFKIGKDAGLSLSSSPRMHRLLIDNAAEAKELTDIIIMAYTQCWDIMTSSDALLTYCEGVKNFGALKEALKHLVRVVPLQHVIIETQLMTVLKDSGSFAAQIAKALVFLHNIDPGDPHHVLLKTPMQELLLTHRAQAESAASIVAMIYQRSPCFLKMEHGSLYQPLQQMSNIGELEKFLPRVVNLDDGWLKATSIALFYDQYFPQDCELVTKVCEQLSFLGVAAQPQIWHPSVLKTGDQLLWLSSGLSVLIQQAKKGHDINNVLDILIGTEHRDGLQQLLHLCALDSELSFQQMLPLLLNHVQDALILAQAINFTHQSVYLDLDEALWCELNAAGQRAFAYAQVINEMERLLMPQQYFFLATLRSKVAEHGLEQLHLLKEALQKLPDAVSSRLTIQTFLILIDKEKPKEYAEQVLNSTTYGFVLCGPEDGQLPSNKELLDISSAFEDSDDEQHKWQLINVNPILLSENSQPEVRQRKTGLKESHY